MRRNETLHILRMAALAFALLPSGFAARVYTWEATWDTRGLKSGVFDAPGEGIYWLDIQLVNGDGTNGNNWAELSQFQFSGGAPSGSPKLFGGASGSLDTKVDLKDTEFFNGFVGKFKAGNTLNFKLRMTSEYDGVGPHDQFSIGLYVGSDFVPISTEDDQLADAFARSDLGDLPSPIWSYLSLVAPLDDSVTLPGPVFTLVDKGTAVPEPGAMGLSAAALLGIWARRKWRR